MTTPAEDARRETEKPIEARVLASASVARFLDPEIRALIVDLTAQLTAELVAERANSEGLRKAAQRVKHVWENTKLTYVEINDLIAALSASPSPTLPNTRMGEDA